MRSRTRLGSAEAEAVAVEALTFLAGDETRLAHFLSLTGLDPGAIRAVAGTSGFLVAVLDHVAGDEGLLLAFSDATGAHPETVMAARAVLAPPDFSE